MDPTSLPIWAQAVLYIVVAVGTGLAGVWKYVKTQDKPGSINTNSVVSASFVSDRTLKDLIDAVREHQDETGRDTKKSHRLAQDLKDAVNELNESVIVQTDTTMNLVRFINREVRKDRSDSFRPTDDTE